MIINYYNQTCIINSYIVRHMRSTPISMKVASTIPSDSSIIFLTESLNICTILAHYILKHDPRSLCILIDFDEQQIVQINYQIQRIMQGLLLQGQRVNTKAKLESLNTSIAKRKLAYQTFGFYCVSPVVFTLDILCNIVHPALVSRVFIKKLERIKSNNHHYNWISQMIQKQSANCKFTLLCQQTGEISQQRFIKLYELFCVSKVVIWPFGRKQIMDTLKQSKQIDQLQHTIKMSNIKQDIQNTLLNIMKQWVVRIPSDKPLIQLFTKQLYLNVNSTRAMMDIYQLRILLFKLINQNYAQWLVTLYKALGSGDQLSLWSLSSQQVQNQIQTMKKLLFNQIFKFQITQNLRTLSVVKQQFTVTYQCKYSMEVLAPIPQKVKQLFKIIQNYSQSIADKVESQQYHYIWIMIPPSLKNQNILHNPYCKHLISILKLLKQSSGQRIWHLKKILQRAPKIKISNKDFYIQNQVMLQQQLQKQLQIFQSMSDQYHITLQFESTFKKKLQLFDQFVLRVQMQKFQYISSQRLKQSQLQISDKIKFRVINNEDFHSVEDFRNYQPNLIIFYSPSLKMLRNIYILQSQINQSSLKQIHMINFSKSIEQNIYKQRILKQDTSFWEISKARPNLPVVTMDIRSRINQLESKHGSKFRQQTKNIISQADPSRLHLFNIDATSIIPARKFYIIIDKRQFKSQLPAVLFHHGFQVIPMFLTISDYILSDDIQIQRKQVSTHDLHNSLRSGRLQTQLKNMSLKIKHPYLLIQFSNKIDFNAKPLTQSYNRVTNEVYSSNIRRQILQLLKKYPKVIPIWSQNCQQTAQIFFMLKQNKPEPDLSIYNTKQTQKQQTQLNVQLVSKTEDQIVS